MVCVCIYIQSDEKYNNFRQTESNMENNMQSNLENAVRKMYLRMYE